MGKYIQNTEIYLPDDGEDHWGEKLNKNFEELNEEIKKVKETQDELEILDEDEQKNFFDSTWEW